MRWRTPQHRTLTASVLTGVSATTGDAATGGMTAARPQPGPHLSAGLRLSFLSPERRETVLLLPTSCEATAHGGDTDVPTRSHGTHLSATTAATTGAALHPVIVVGHLPPQLSLPTLTSSGAVHCPAIAPHPSTHTSGSASRMTPLRFSWRLSHPFNQTESSRDGRSVNHPPPGTVALLSLDNRLNQPATANDECAATGAALICASLCEGLPSSNQQLHARLKLASSFTFSGFSVGACLKLGGAATFELPVQVAVNID